MVCANYDCADDRRGHSMYFFFYFGFNPYGRLPTFVSFGCSWVPYKRAKDVAILQVSLPAGYAFTRTGNWLSSSCGLLVSFVAALLAASR
jgi:hypothetical protein